MPITPFLSLSHSHFSLFLSLTPPFSVILRLNYYIQFEKSFEGAKHTDHGKKSLQAHLETIMDGQILCVRNATLT